MESIILLPYWLKLLNEIISPQCLVVPTWSNLFLRDTATSMAIDVICKCNWGVASNRRVPWNAKAVRNVCVLEVFSSGFFSQAGFCSEIKLGRLLIRLLILTWILVIPPQRSTCYIKYDLLKIHTIFIFPKCSTCIFVIVTLSSP